MSLRDQIRRWIDTHRDQPPLILTDVPPWDTRADPVRQISPEQLFGTYDLTDEQREMLRARYVEHGGQRDARGGIVHSDANADTPPWFRSWDHIDPAIYRQHEHQQRVERFRRAFDAWSAVALTGAEDDTAPRDPRPDYCWRCDALPATDPVIGLCAKCHTDLKGRA